MPVLSKPLRNLLFAIAALGLVVHTYCYSFITDDAYISFRYSYNFANHGELVFNLGERVEGFTNFLWTVLLSLCLKAGVAPEISSQILGTLCGVVTLGLIYLLTRLYRRDQARSLWDFVGVYFAASSSCFAVWCTGGLETQLFTMLALAGMFFYMQERLFPTTTNAIVSGSCFALSAMTRPEGMLLFGLTAFHRLAVQIVSDRRFFPTVKDWFWGLGFVLPFGTFFAWRLHYYGYPFPNTFYVKGSVDASAVRQWGLLYVWDYIDRHRIYILLPIVLYLVYRLFRRSSAESRDKHAPISATFLWSYAVSICLVYTAYIVRVGGDFMTLGRFFTPIFPLLALMIQEGFRRIVEWQHGRIDAWRPIRASAFLLLLVGAMIVNSVWLYRENERLAYYRWGLDTVGYLRKFAHDHLLVGNWMREHFPKDTYLATGGAGAIVYGSHFRTLDMFGLNDEWIAHHAPVTGTRPGHTKFAPWHYVASKRPDVLCHDFKQVDTPYRPSMRDNLYWRNLGYAWICMDPPGLNPRYFCCLKRMDRELGPFPIDVGA